MNIFGFVFASMFLFDVCLVLQLGCFDIFSGLVSEGTCKMRVVEHIGRNDASPRGWLGRLLFA